MRPARAERVYVTGCGANLDEGVQRYARERDGHSQSGPSRRQRGCGGRRRASLAARVADHRRERVRAFLKIQDGCSFSAAHSASFRRCAVRHAVARSADVVVEARRRAREGYREIVLSGINLGCYRDRAGRLRPRLDCCRQLAAKIHGLDRIRLSSIEVNHLTDELIETMQSAAECCAPSARAAAVG